MKRRYLILIGLIIVVLAVGNVYFLINAGKPDYMVRIGMPVVDDNNAITAVDFTKSEFLQRKEDVDTVFFSLLSGQTISKPSVANRAPDAVLWIGASAGYGIAYQVVLWLDGEQITYTMGLDSSSNYKQIEFASDLTALVQEYITQYN